MTVDSIKIHFIWLNKSIFYTSFFFSFSVRLSICFRSHSQHSQKYHSKRLLRIFFPVFFRPSEHSLTFLYFSFHSKFVGRFAIYSLDSLKFTYANDFVICWIKFSLRYLKEEAKRKLMKSNGQKKSAKHLWIFFVKKHRLVKIDSHFKSSHEKDMKIFIYTLHLFMSGTEWLLGIGKWYFL